MQSFYHVWSRAQALQLSVQQLLESVEQSRSSESSNGDQRELPDLLCTCFSAATNILTICKVKTPLNGYFYIALSVIPTNQPVCVCVEKVLENWLDLGQFCLI